jgi:primosomal protein N' (replication factor Y)
MKACSATKRSRSTACAMCWRLSTSRLSSAASRRLVDWVADYYLSNHAAVLRMVISSSAALSAGGTVTEYRPSGIEPARLTPQRAAALDALVDAQGLVRELAEQAGVSEGVIRGLVKVGALEPVTVSIDAPFAAPDPEHHHPELSDLQEAAAGVMRDAVKARRVRADCARWRYRIGQDRNLF